MTSCLTSHQVALASTAHSYLYSGNCYVRRRLHDELINCILAVLKNIVSCGMDVAVQQPEDQVVSLYHSHVTGTEHQYALPSMDVLRPRDAPSLVEPQYMISDHINAPQF